MWRFHRIYVDGIQHNFTLKLYCSSSLVTRKFFPAVKRHPLVKTLYNFDMLKGLLVARSDSYDIKDDHDSTWPMPIKEIWPYYIHGVSRAWLTMVQSYYQKALVSEEIKDPTELDFWSKIDLYGLVADAIEEDWGRHAKHAMFHHANLLFGNKWIRGWYLPGSVIISEKRNWLMKKIFGSHKPRRKDNFTFMSIRF